MFSALLRGRKPEHGGGFAVHELHLAGTGHHDDPLVEQFDDGLLLLEQGAEAELFRNGVGRRRTMPRVWEWYFSRSWLTLSTAMSWFLLSKIGAAEQLQRCPRSGNAPRR